MTSRAEAYKTNMQFEVRCTDSDGVEHVIGWSADLHGGRLLSIATRHLEVVEFRIIKLPVLH